jgi:hypothetical protein
MSPSERVLQALSKKRSGAQGYVGAIVGIAISLILFATIGFIGLQLLATAGTTSFQPVVVLIAIVLVSIMAALAVALSFMRYAGIRV